MKVFPSILFAGCWAQCQKADFASIDCSNYSFLVTINQTCFDYHWNRGSDWNETMVFGSSGEASCEFNVADQGSTPMEIKFDECTVAPNYPDSNDKTVIDFNLAGQILEHLIGNDDIESYFDFNFKCEFQGVTDLEQMAQLYDADKLKVNESLTLDSSMIPAPNTLTLESSDRSTWSVNCVNCDNVKVGDVYEIQWNNVYGGDLSFRIENIWIGPNSGEKTIHLVENGCVKSNFFLTDIVYSQARILDWSVFKFKSSNSLYFTFDLVLCNPNEENYCLGTSDCLNGIGNQQLFENWINQQGASTATTTTTTTTTTTSGARRRRSTDDENNTLENTRKIVEYSDLSVEVNFPDGANTKEEIVDGETIIRLSNEAPKVFGASGAQELFNSAFLALAAIYFL
ncbi:Oidioi.mRNA.OKI2018_I69.PAR.g9125.t1.cds [Oikopleura dioica]|uniref:Oidioi.mRNA.OKI2018_I69.PAR.g9125.t1.cds n=1 Tax=Oikopleura dioica TaxID=34765 RepID=A0ABN7RQ03_OIKDI|nr:Oidioi.mRNA.OKI2018_I69.PAR.g9125.t1.cds [Oikopleura dioica]